MADNETFFAFAIETARRAGAVIRAGAQRPIDVRSKGLRDLLTDVDLAAERTIVEAIGRRYPDHDVLTEETPPEQRTSRYQWIIDPLDGTTNYIHGVSPFSISIALQEKDELISGIVYEPIQKECFYSWAHAPAYLNGDEIRVSGKKELSETLIATGFPYTDFSRIDEYMGSLRRFMESSHGVRRLGSAAIDLAYVACGRYDAFYEYHLKPWDVAAGTVLIRQAGGKVCDFNGGSDFLFGENYVGTNSDCHDEFMRVIKHYFK